MLSSLSTQAVKGIVQLDKGDTIDVRDNGLLQRK